MVAGRATPGRGEIIVDGVSARNNRLEIGDVLEINESPLKVVGLAEGGNILVAGRQTAPLWIRPGRDVLRGLGPQPGFISPYLVPLQVILFGVILAGIWTTYGYVVWLLLRIRRERP